MRFFVGFFVVVLTLGVSFGVSMGLVGIVDKAFELNLDEDTGWPLMLGLNALIGAALLVVDWRLFKRWYAKCPACRSFIPSDATRCRYCCLDIGAPGV